MKEVFRIEGGHLLEGSVRISGSKNATVALIPAAILANGPVTIVGVPQISDVKSLQVLLKELGVEVIFKAEDHIIMDPKNIKNVPLISDAVNKLRASYYFMGALLGRYKYAKIKMPGGCYLGPRPIDLHLKGFEALGAKIEYKDGCYILEAEELVGDRIFLDIASVGATINIMCAAVYAKGKTIIENAAKEPEIIDVATLLNKMGAKIRGVGTNIITIEGVEELSGCFHEIIPDRIEAGTYIIMAAACAKHMRISNIIPQHLESLLLKLEEIGVNMKVGVDYVEVFESNDLNAVEIKTLPYPGFATDLQQPLTALLTQTVGLSRVKDTIYPERFKHCAELAKMGAEVEVGKGVSSITGPTPLTGTTVTATDLRCGASLVIAGLMAEGTTIIKDAYHIYRGYDNIKEKLKSLGADVE